MRRDGTRKHDIRPALLPTVVTLVLLMTAAAGAQDMDPNDRYTLVVKPIKAIAPKVAQSLTWGIVDTVSSRVDTVGSLQATMERLEASGIVQYGLPKLSHRMLISYDGTPLLIGETGQVNGAQGTLWGFGFTTGGDYRSLGSGPDAEVDWDGEVISGHLGFDVRPVREMLAGLTVGVSQTSTHFKVDDKKGFLDHHMITASPYLSWVLFPGMWWWATATYGVGEATMADRHEPGTTPPHAGDSSLLSGAVGFNVNMIDRRGGRPRLPRGRGVQGRGQPERVQGGREARRHARPVDEHVARPRHGAGDLRATAQRKRVPDPDARGGGPVRRRPGGQRRRHRAGWPTPLRGSVGGPHAGSARTRAGAPRRQVARVDRRRAGADFVRPRRVRAVLERDAELRQDGIHRDGSDRDAGLSSGACWTRSWATAACRSTACRGC